MERPVECGGCQKGIENEYKEIVRGKVQCWAMCGECPVLEKKLYGDGIKKEEKAFEGDAGVVCGRCHTSMEEMRMGSLVGCSECYEVFGDLLVQELIAREKIPMEMRKIGKRQLHKEEGKEMEMKVGGDLIKLNEELNEALRKENYEKAAQLRDQIQKLKEGTND